MKIKSRQVVITILGIVILLISILWLLSYLENKEEIRSRETRTQKLIDENEILKKEVEGLKEQNNLLIRVLEIKQRDNDTNKKHGTLHK